MFHRIKTVHLAHGKIQTRVAVHDCRFNCWLYDWYGIAKQPEYFVMKAALFFIILTVTSCKTVTGVVTDEQGTPVRDAMVSIDCAKAAIRTAQSGYFKFKARVRGKKCIIRAWVPGDTARATIIQDYTYKAGAVKLTLKRKE